MPLKMIKPPVCLPDRGKELRSLRSFIPGKIDSGGEAAARSVRQKKADGSRRFRQ